MTTKRVKLTDVCTQVFAGGDVPKDRYSEIRSEAYPIPIYANAEKDNGLYGYTDTARVEEECVTVAARGTIGFTAIRKEPFLPVVRLITVIPNQEKIKLGYLYYALRNLKPKSSGTSIPQLTIPDIKKYSFNIAPVEQQEIIITILDKIENLINFKKQELELFDNLIKSRFVEMFGDPVSNFKGWKEISINKILNGKTSNGFFSKRDDYCEDGNVRILGVADIVNRMYSKVENLPITNAISKDIEKYEVKYGDMLFCRSSLVAAGIGKASIVPFDSPKNILFECHVIRVQLDLVKCVPEYIQMLTTTAYFRNQVMKHAKTSTMTTIGQDGILSSMILLPPIEEQKKFLEFIKQTDKLKFEVHKSLDEAQLLFDSLMQKYFG